MQDFTCDEWPLFKIQNGIDDLLRLAHSAHGLYSIARERVIALRPPLVRAARAAGSEAMGCSAIVAVTLTSRNPPEASRLLPSARGGRTPKIDRDHRREIGFGIVSELLGDENTGVIYQRVDSSETLNGPVDDALGGIATGDVAIYDQDSRITGGIDRARVGDDAITNLAKAFDQAGADATRSTGNNDNLLFEGLGWVAASRRLLWFYHLLLAAEACKVKTAWGHLQIQAEFSKAGDDTS